MVIRSKYFFQFPHIFSGGFIIRIERIKAVRNVINNSIATTDPIIWIHQKSKISSPISR